MVRITGSPGFSLASSRLNPVDYWFRRPSDRVASGGQSPCCGDLGDLVSHQQLDLAYGQTLQELVDQRARGGRELLADGRRWA